MWKQSFICEYNLKNRMSVGFVTVSHENFDMSQFLWTTRIRICLNHNQCVNFRTNSNCFFKTLNLQFLTHKIIIFPNACMFKNHFTKMIWKKNTILRTILLLVYSFNTNINYFGHLIEHIKNGIPNFICLFGPFVSWGTQWEGCHWINVNTYKMGKVALYVTWDLYLPQCFSENI